METRDKEDKGDDPWKQKRIWLKTKRPFEEKHQNKSEKTKDRVKEGTQTVKEDWVGAHESIYESPWSILP